MRLDQATVARGIVPSRSQAESFIKLGSITVNGKVISKPAFQVTESDVIALNIEHQYVSRAALKLASVAEQFHIDFRNKTVLDIGSSTGGFTEYALSRGAAKVFAVDVGTNQLHPSLRGNPKIELHEKTDIRDFLQTAKNGSFDVVLADVSFISLRDILPFVARVCTPQTRIAAMVKPQFEAIQTGVKHKGVIKNDRMRRDILKDFESWVKQLFVIVDKADSGVHGSQGNVERFYLLKISG